MKVANSSKRGGPGVRFGLLLTAVHGRGSDPRVQLDEHMRLASRAVSAGFDLLMVGQHYLSDDLRFFQPIPYLAYFSQAFPRIRVGTGVLLLPLANPVDIAEQVATLDVLSNGKAILGVGIGYSHREFAAFGVQGNERTSVLEESLGLITRLWSGEPVVHNGRWTVRTEGAAVVPIQGVNVPVWLAGQAKGSVCRAGRLGASWYAPPFLSDAELALLASEYRAAREGAGYGPPTTVPIRREVFVADSVAEARKRVVPYASGRADTYMRWGLGGSLPAGSTFGHGALTVTDRFVLGPPEACAAQLQRMFDRHGVTDFVLKVQWPGMDIEESMDQLERFTAEVMPRLGATP